MSRKKADDLSNEELLSQLDTAPTDEVKDNLERDIFGFIRFFNFEQGNNAVSKKFLLKLYRAWANNKINRAKFNNVFGSYFPINTEKAYSLNQSSIDITISTRKILVPEYKYLKSLQSQQHFKSFISHLKLKSGNESIPEYVLYHLYDKWLFNRTTRTRFKLSKFIGFSRLHFKSKKTSDDVVWFKLDESIYEALPKDRVMQMIESRKTNEKKEYKKKKKQVPKSGPWFKSKDQVGGDK